MQISKLQNESSLDHHKRLVYGKLVDKTLADFDFSEIAQVLYGREYSSDVARRMMYGSRMTLELIDEEAERDISDSDILRELESKKTELQIERQKFFDQRREYNKLLTADGRKEHLYSVLADAASNLNKTVGVVFRDHVHPGPDSSSKNEAVLVLSDWHYGMTVDNVFNQYNTEICKRRVLDVVADASERIILHGCSRLHVVVLGDLFHGAIHTSARVASEELVCEQIMQVSEILAQAIMELSRFVDNTTVYMTYGNHGRTVQTKKDNIHRDNMERLIPWWLTQRLANDSGVEVAPESDTEFLHLNVCGHNICASHGDLDSVKTSPRLLTALFHKQYGIDLEYIILGDKHHRESFEELGVTAMICGSLCGSDDYANDKRLFSSPSQTLLIVNEETGVDAEYRLRC